jgi:phenylpropionate dioxygenase-like ring-hydroxylating dioxygenase large terminal subunit
MKMNIRSAWTPIAPTPRRISTKTRPEKVALHGRDMSLYWHDGVPRLTTDACFHRGASLSIHGTIDADGCIRCGYHGKKSRGLKARDVHGVVWTNDQFESSEIPIPWEFVDSSQRVFSYTESFPNTNPLLMVENTLDYAHLSHVHAFSLTNGDPRVEIDAENNTARYMYETTMDKALTVENQFWAPWSTCLRFYLDDMHLFSLHFSWIPRHVNHTDLVVRVSRTHGHWSGMFGDWILQIANTLPLIEDRDIVQSIPGDRSWRDDRLAYDDRFLRLYRTKMEEQYPTIVADYMGLTE